MNDARIVLGLLESLERDAGQSQRRLASDLGIALGLVNAYLKRCVKKGLVKVREAPARRYVYYLTPQGFAEKSRLTVEYLSHSFGFFRQAKSDCLAALQGAAAHGLRRIVLAGRSDLAEIVIICAVECGIEIVAVVDPGAPIQSFLGRPVVASYDLVVEPYDAVMITDLISAQATYDAATDRFDRERVLVPTLLRVLAPQPTRASDGAALAADALRQSISNNR
ncbi:MAG: winged helix-turn-helix transcriptional regulator [Pseudolabrys sp.]